MEFNKYELFTKISINILLIFIFIGFFFFTYGAHIVKQVIKSEMNFLCESITNISSLFGKSANKYLYNQVNNLKLLDLSHEDQKVKESNKKILNKVIKLNIMAIIIVVGCILYANYKFNNNSEYPLNKIIPQNIFILFIIANVLFVFLTYFVARYISLNPNNIKENILNNLIKHQLI